MKKTIVWVGTKQKDDELEKLNIVKNKTTTDSQSYIPTRNIAD